MIIILDSAFSSAIESGWLHDLLNTIIGAAIGSGVTIWALYRTFKYDQKKEEQDKVQFQKEKVRYFQSIIAAINTDLEEQILHYKSYAESIKQDPIDLPFLTKIPLNEVDRIVNKINHENYYHAYLDEFGDDSATINEFRAIISTINYFDGNLEVIKTSLDKSINFNNERHITLKSMIDMAIDDAAELINNQQIFSNYKPLWNFINEHMIGFQTKKVENYSLQFYFENFLEPMKQELVKYAKDIPEVHRYITQLKKAITLYHIVQLHNLNVAKEFEHWHETMLEEHQKLKAHTKRLLAY